MDILDLIMERLDVDRAEAEEKLEDAKDDLHLMLQAQVPNMVKIDRYLKRNLKLNSDYLDYILE